MIDVDMAASAFIVLVPEAEVCVGELRKRFDATTHLGVPAHISVLVPFMPWEQITPTVLSRAQAALKTARAFSFRLSIIPHLTVANGNAVEAEAAATELEAAITTHGPIHGRCSTVSLFENSSGRWEEVHVFSLIDTDG